MVGTFDGPAPTRAPSIANAFDAAPRFDRGDRPRGARSDGRCGQVTPRRWRHTGADRVFRQRRWRVRRLAVLEIP